MSRMMKSFTTLTMMLMTALSVMPAIAENEAPLLTLKIHPLEGKDLHDGAVIGSGWVVYQGGHSGYRIWLEAEKNGTASERYVIRGKHNASHRLNVRLAGDSWVPDPKNGSGVTRQARDEQVSFSIVADGGQAVSADQYVVTANVMPLTP